MRNPAPSVSPSPAVPPVMPSPSPRVPEKTYKQGYDEGYRKASDDILTDSRNKIAALKEKYRKLIPILCGIVFLFGAAISGWLFGNYRYNSGYQAGNATGIVEGQKAGREEGYNQATSDLTNSFKSQVNQAFDNGYKKGKEDQAAETAAAMQKQQTAPADQRNITKYVVPETTSKPQILYSRHKNNGSWKNPSPEIKKIQERLKELGYLHDKADGIIGDKTEEAIKSFQKDHGLPETGMVDTVTQQLLFPDAYESVSPTAALTLEGVSLSTEYQLPLPVPSVNNQSN